VIDTSTSGSNVKNNQIACLNRAFSTETAEEFRRIPRGGLRRFHRPQPCLHQQHQFVVQWWHAIRCLSAVVALDLRRQESAR
jgi:hypothetical protein